MMNLKLYKFYLSFFTYLLGIILIPSGIILAGEVQYLNRSPRGLLMGDAYTAVADDEYTLFYNPAALGRHSGLSIAFLNPDIGVTNVLSEVDRFQNFPSNDPAAMADRILGFPLNVHVGGTPGVKMGTFGLSFMAADTTNLEVRNATYPSLDLDYRLDRGFIIGYAYSFGSKDKSRKKKKGGSSGGGGGSKTSIGIAVKNFNRQGIKNSFDLFGLQLLNAVANNKEINGIKKALGYSHGKAWGADAGIEHSISSNISQFTIGLSAMDLADTRFTLTSGDRELPRQKMAVNLGTAWSQDFYIVNYTFSLDVAPLNQGLAWGRTVHAGLELGLPIVSGYFGWNGGYISYGLGINIWIVKLYAGFYGVELGGQFRQEEGKRGLIYLSILDFSFDT